MAERRRRTSQGRHILSFFSGRLRARASKEAPATDKKRRVSEPGPPRAYDGAAAPAEKPQGKIKQAVYYCFNLKSRRKSTGSPSRRSFASGISAVSGASSTAQPLLTTRGYSEDLVIRRSSRKPTARALAASAPPHARWDSGDEKRFEDVATFSDVDDRASSGYKDQASMRQSRCKRATEERTEGLASEIGHKGAKGDTSATLEYDTALENVTGDACPRPSTNSRAEDREKCDASRQPSHQELLAETSEDGISRNTSNTSNQSAEDVVYNTNIATKNTDYGDLEACAPLGEESTPANSFTVTCEDNDDEVATTKNSPPGNAPNLESTRTCILFGAASEDHDEKVVTPKSSRQEISAGDLVNINGGSPNNSLAHSPSSTASPDTLDQAASGWAALPDENDGSPKESLGYSPASTASTDIMNEAADEMGWAALLTKNDLPFRDDSPNSLTISDDVVSPSLSPQVISKPVWLESIPEEADEDVADECDPIPMSRSLPKSSCSTPTRSSSTPMSSSSIPLSSSSIPMSSSIQMSSPTTPNESDQPSYAEIAWVQLDSSTSADSASDAKNAITEPTKMDSFNDAAHHSDSEQSSRVQTPEGFRCLSMASGFEPGQRGTSTTEIGHLNKGVEVSCTDLRKSSASADATSRNSDCDPIVSHFFFGEDVSESDALCESVLKSSPENEAMQPEGAAGETAILCGDGQSGEVNASQLEPPAVVPDQHPDSAEGPDDNALDACGLPTEGHIAEANHEQPTGDTGSAPRLTVTGLLGHRRLGGFGVLSLRARNSSSARTRRLGRYEDTHARSSRLQMSLKRRRPRFHDDCVMKLRPSSVLALWGREEAISPLTHDSSTQTDVSRAVPGPSVSTQTTFDPAPSQSDGDHPGRQQPVIEPWVLLSYAAVLMVVAHSLGAWIFHGKL